MRTVKIVYYVDAKSHHSYSNSSMIIYSRDDVIFNSCGYRSLHEAVLFPLAEHWFRHGGGVVLLRHENVTSGQTVTKNVTKSGGVLKFIVTTCA